MEETMPNTPPLACIPGAIPAEARPAHFALIARLFHDAVRERRRLDRGYAFRFDAEAFDDIARFVANERRCCPFLDFTIEVEAAGGAVWLRITGPAGTPEFLESEMGIERA